MLAAATTDEANFIAASAVVDGCRRRKRLVLECQAVAAAAANPIEAAVAANPGRRSKLASTRPCRTAGVVVLIS